MDMNIEKFDPTTAELNALVEKSQTITVTDINDATQMKVVTVARIELKNARVSISKKGKELRDDANKFAKAVIAKEKELIAIIEPEETRLSELEEKVKDQIIMAERTRVLPTRKTQLENISDNVKVDDEYLLTLDNDSFNTYYNERVEAKKELVAAKDREEKAQAEREKEMAAREEKARKEEQEKAEIRIKEETARVEREANEKVAKEELEKVKEEARIKEQQESLEKDNKYKTWLSSHNYDTINFKTVDNGETVALYKLVDTFKK